MDRLTAIWHTEGRRQPGVLGKDPAGHPLPGGPYTDYQGIGGLLVAVAMTLTAKLWVPIFDLDIIRAVGAVLIAVFFTVRAAAKIDYTNIALLWGLLGGMKCALIHVADEHPVITSTGRPISKLTPSRMESSAAVVTFAERESQTSTVVAEQLDLATEEATPQPSTPVDKTPRRRPRTPLRGHRPAAALQTVAEPILSTSPTSALENFLQAAHATGAH